MVLFISGNQFRIVVEVKGKTMAHGGFSF